MMNQSESKVSWSSGRTIGDWQEYISAWADRKGWYKPQCEHENAETKYYPSETSEVRWCPDCGGVKDGSNDWELPKLASARSVAELYLLMVSEVTEAFEEHREHHEVGEIYWRHTADPSALLPYGYVGAFGLVPDTEMIKAGWKPEGQPVELADAQIRGIDFAAHNGINLDAVMTLKMLYNETRPERHGGKRA